MEIRYGKHYSGHLGREMEYKIYGHRGKPVLFIPCQGGRFFDFENFKMIDTWAKWIEAGDCTVFAVDSIDGEAYADFGGDCRHRMEMHEKWFHYVTEEFVPLIRHESGLRNFHDELIMVFGASMGAMHAANLFFRRPDLFDGVFAISGLYEPASFFPTYRDDLIYQNSPCFYLANMPHDHYYIDMYNHRKMVFCVGQGAWEDELLASTRWLDGVLRDKGIHAQVDYWGHDVNHDWPWRFKMCDHYVPQFLYGR